MKSLSKLSTAKRVLLPVCFMVTATVFGCGGSDTAVEQDVSTESKAQTTNNFCCPKGDSWFISDPAPEDEFYDKNQDGLICFKPVNGRGSSIPEPGFTIKDNNNPCPAS